MQDSFVLTCNLISFSMYKGYKGFVCIHFRVFLLYGMNANEEIHVLQQRSRTCMVCSLHKFKG